MRGNTLILGLALASATTVVALDVCVTSRTERSNPVLVSTVDVPLAASGATSVLDDVTVSDVQVSTRIVAPSIEDVEERLAASGAAYRYDVTFVTVDSDGRPVPWTNVELALQGFRFNSLGSSDMKGRLNVKWTGTSAAFDGIVRCGTPTLGSRLCVRAGAPATLSIRADGTRGETYDPTQDDSLRGFVGGDLYRRGLRFSRPPSFRTDADGRGQFVDADLIAFIPSPGGPRHGGGGGGCGGCRSYRSQALHIEAFVHDEHGKPLRGVGFRVIKEQGEGWTGETNFEGKLVVDTTGSGRADVWIGGHDRALVCKTLDAETMSTPWDVELAKVPIASGLLVDENGVPLHAWNVEARDEAGSFVGAAFTNATGEFEIGVPDGRAVELRARLLMTEPACLVAKRFVPGRAPRTVVATARIASFSWWIELPFAVEGDVPEARIVRCDTGESVVVALSEVEDRTDGPARFRFRTDRLLAGDYAVTSFAPGCSPARARGVAAVLEGPDFGKFELGSVRDIDVPRAEGDAAGASWVTVVKRVHGLNVMSNPMQLPGKFALSDGEYELEYRNLPSRGPAKYVRPFRVGDGEPKRTFGVVDAFEPPPPTSPAR